MTSMRRNDVASTSFRRHVPTRFLINQCQIITFLILKSDIIENSRTELFCQYLQIKLKLHLLLFYPSTWYICVFFLFHIEIEGKCGWIIGVCWPPLSNYWGGPGPPAPPPPPPSSYAYEIMETWRCTTTSLLIIVQKSKELLSFVKRSKINIKLYPLILTFKQ